MPRREYPPPQPLQPATDEQLAQRAKEDRSRSLAVLYQTLAAAASCSCTCEHRDVALECPKAIWETAARLALFMNSV